MNVPDFLRAHKERLAEDAKASEHDQQQELLRRELNAQKIYEVLEGLVYLRLFEVAIQIKAEGFLAEVERVTSSEGRIAVSVILKTSQVPVDDRGKFKLEYAGNDTTAMIHVQIRRPSPSQEPFIELGKFSYDELDSPKVDSHVERLLKEAFK